VEGPAVSLPVLTQNLFAPTAFFLTGEWQKPKRLKGFVRLFRPRYAGANLGHPSISVHLYRQSLRDRGMLMCSLLGEVLE
jgi:hypothetical protein